MRVGLIGYGKMGRGIFSLLSDSSLSVTVVVRDPAKADDAQRKHDKRIRRSITDEAELSRKLDQCRFTTDWNELAACDVVIESITEDFDIKIDLLRRAERLLRPDAVLTTNSSSFPPTKLAEHLSRPGQFAGYHFFHPVQLTSVVEIIVAKDTVPAVVEILRQVSEAIHRRPLVIQDYSGSGINVILTGLTCEALYMLEQGVVSPSEIDGIAGEFARIGPCEAVDVIGVPFFTDVLDRTLKAFPFRFVMPELLTKLIRDGRHGKYAGGGLFLYRDDRPYDDAPGYYANPQQTHSPVATSITPADVKERLMLQVYYCMLYMTQLGVGDLRDFATGIHDLIGLKHDPLEEILTLGRDGLKAKYDQYARDIGPRYDCTPFLGVLDRLETYR